MNNKDFVKDTTKRAIEKYHNLYVKILQEKYGTLKTKVDKHDEDIDEIKNKIDNLSALNNTELNYIIDKENNN